MRYLEGQQADPLYPHSESMHHMLTLSMLMSIVIGAVLLVLGVKGNVLWLKVWSVGLILCSIGYLIADAINIF